MYYALKVLLTASLVVIVSEASKRSTLLGALFASLPLISILGMVWLYVDTGDTQKVAGLSASVFWLVLPSLPMFLLLPLLLKWGFGFWPSLAGSIAITVGLYLAMLAALSRFGIKM